MDMTGRENPIGLEFSDIESYYGGSEVGWYLIDLERCGGFRWPTRAVGLVVRKAYAEANSRRKHRCGMSKRMADLRRSWNLGGIPRDLGKCDKDTKSK